MPEQYKDDLSAAIHELADDLHRHGAIDKQTMREFDASCLCKAESLTPDEITDDGVLTYFADPDA